MGALRQAAGFARGLHRFLRHPVTADVAHADLRRGCAGREDRLLASLDQLVWRAPSSPYRDLLRHAGIDQRDLAQIVSRSGVDAALRTLLDEGVYVAYEEYTGASPARRGSARFEWQPADFLNPVVAADYMGSTSGTRGAGTPVGKSFAHLRAVASGDLVIRAAWGAAHAPSAVWLPVLPSSAGLNNVLRLAVTGAPPERWFSHVDPRTSDITQVKRLANRVVPSASRLLGVPLPRPQHTPATNPDPVLAWCADAVRRAGTAWLTTYPTSAVVLARRAIDRGQSLSGVCIRVGGEPLTEAKAEAISASGAMPVNGYAFAQMGRVAVGCRHSPAEELHVLEHHAAVITRLRPAGNGVSVPALCWTSFDPSTPTVHLNLENDDYALLTHDDRPCQCLVGQLGARARLAHVRGLSKVLAGGITLPAERLEELAERVLPARFGGGPGSYQFTEADVDGTSRVVVRVHPELGPIDEHAVAEVVRAHLRADDLGVLADEVWRGAGALRVERQEPVASASGKLLVFEPLR